MEGEEDRMLCVREERKVWISACLIEKEGKLEEGRKG